VRLPRSSPANWYSDSVSGRLGHVEELAGLFQALGRLGLLEAGEQAADVAQVRQRIGLHAQCHAARRAEQVDEAGNGLTDDLFTQHRRPAGTQQLVADCRQFQPRRHRLGEFSQLAQAFELGHEVAQAPLFHRSSYKNSFLYC